MSLEEQVCDVGRRRISNIPRSAGEATKELQEIETRDHLQRQTKKADSTTVKASRSNSPEHPQHRAPLRSDVRQFRCPPHKPSGGLREVPNLPGTTPLIMAAMGRASRAVDDEHCWPRLHGFIHNRL